MFYFCLFIILTPRDTMYCMCICQKCMSWLYLHLSIVLSRCKADDSDLLCHQHGLPHVCHPQFLQSYLRWCDNSSCIQMMGAIRPQKINYLWWLLHQKAAFVALISVLKIELDIGVGLNLSHVYSLFLPPLMSGIADFHIHLPWAQERVTTRKMWIPKLDSSQSECGDWNFLNLIGSLNEKCSDIKCTCIISSGDEAQFPKLHLNTLGHSVIDCCTFSSKDPSLTPRTIVLYQNTSKEFVPKTSRGRKAHRPSQFSKQNVAPFFGWKLLCSNTGKAMLIRNTPQSVRTLHQTDPS